MVKVETSARHLILWLLIKGTTDLPPIWLKKKERENKKTTKKEIPEYIYWIWLSTPVTMSLEHGNLL